MSFEGHWSTLYVGIPHRPHGADREGCDCWGLVRLVYAERHGVELPAYRGAATSEEERREVAALVGLEAGDPAWRKIAGSPRPFDVLVFRRGPIDSHVGLVAEGMRMLHVAAHDQVRIDKFGEGRWARRLTGVYRRRELDR